jgi:hypothetical protein
MTPEEYIRIFGASLPGTVVMTLFMYFYSAFFKKETRVVHIFGSMLTGNVPVGRVSGKPKPVLTGLIAHFLVGYFLALVYNVLIENELIEINIQTNTLIGFLTGLFSVIAWAFYFFLHFHPPRLDKLHFFIALVIAHIFFAIITMYSFYIVF